MMLVEATAAASAEGTSMAPPTQKAFGAWGSTSLRSCDALIQRLERNDPQLVDVVILPSKTFGPNEVGRLASILEERGFGGGGRDKGGGRRTDDPNVPTCPDYATNGTLTTTYHWRSLSASSHPLPPPSLARLGQAIAVSSSLPRAGPVLVGLAVGDETTGDEGIHALCRDGFMSVRNNTNGQRGNRRDNNDDYHDDETRVPPATCVLSLEWLDVSRKGMTGRGFADLVECLHGSPTLRQLNVRHNDLSNAHQELESLGKRNGEQYQWFPAVEELDMSHCQLEPEFMREFFPRLRSPPRDPDPSIAASEFPGLRLRLAGNVSMKDVGLRGVWECLWDRLVELDVSGCELGDEAVAYLCGDNDNGAIENGVVAHPLRILNVSDNGIGAKGGAALGRAIRRPFVWAHLSELYLARNPRLGSDGVKSIVDGLKDRHQQQQPPTLQPVRLLDVSVTGCDDPSVALEAIQHSGVETLLLHGNQLGVAASTIDVPDGARVGFDVLARGLRGGHRTLRYLDLSQNGAHERSVVTLLNSVAMAMENEDGLSSTASVLATLVLGGNEVGSDVDAAVARAQGRHPDLVVPRR